MKHPFLLTCVFSLGISNGAVATSFQEKKDMLLQRLNAYNAQQAEQSEESSAQDDVRCPCTKPRPRKTVESESLDNQENVLETEDVTVTEQTKNDIDVSLDMEADDVDTDEVEYTINEAGERCPCSKPRPRAQQ